jgi:hypothetical protein
MPRKKQEPTWTTSTRYDPDLDSAIIRISVDDDFTPAQAMQLAVKLVATASSYGVEYTDRKNEGI